MIVRAKTCSLQIECAGSECEFLSIVQLNEGVGLQAFNPEYLIRPESILYNLAGDLVASLINKNAIKATYFNANAKEIQAVYNYERSILNAHIEVVNQLSRMDNFTKNYETKAKEVDILHSRSLFQTTCLVQQEQIILKCC